MINTNSTKMILPSILVLGALTGCAIGGAIGGAIHHTQGTECLEKGDYEAAIEHFQIAVKENPDFSKSQNNLAVAYLGCGDVEKAWYHSRQASICPNADVPALVTFMQLCQIKVTNLNQPGTPLEMVLSQLGEPDERIEKGEKTSIFYGCYEMDFVDDKLVKAFFLIPTELEKAVAKTLAQFGYSTCTQ